MQWLLDLWHKNKILFWILLPAVALAFGLKLYQEYQFGMAKKSLKDANEESNKRQKKIAEQEKKAADAMKKADEASDRRKAREESDKLNLDWHKKNDSE